MRNLVGKVRAYVGDAERLSHVVPIDHEETAFYQQVFWFVAIYIPGIMFIGWIFTTPYGVHAAAALPTMLFLFCLYFLSQLFWAWKIHRLAKEFAPSS